MIKLAGSRHSRCKGGCNSFPTETLGAPPPKKNKQLHTHDTALVSLRVYFYVDGSVTEASAWVYLRWNSECGMCSGRAAPLRSLASRALSRLLAKITTPPPLHSYDPVRETGFFWGGGRWRSKGVRFRLACRFKNYSFWQSVTVLRPLGGAGGGTSPSSAKDRTN